MIGTQAILTPTKTTTVNLTKKGGERVSSTE